MDVDAAPGEEATARQQQQRMQVFERLLSVLADARNQARTAMKVVPAGRLLGG